MEKAILKTLIYANIFEYPLKAYEIHKWLIGRKATLRQVEKELIKLNKESRIKNKAGYYFLPGRNGLVAKRKRREKQSSWYIKKARLLTQVLKVIPWIKLVGISGGLALNNADKRDDIDLFVVTASNRLWLSRILIIGILDFLGVRRKVKMKNSQVAGKLCPNIILEEEKLEQENKDIFIAHEVLQMKVLWQRNRIYSKYLMDNAWVFKFLPNWIAADTSLRGSRSVYMNVGRSNLKNRLPRSLRSLAITGAENLAKRFQLMIMKKPEGMERIQDGALYFHPNDCRLQILSVYKQKISRA